MNYLNLFAADCRELRAFSSHAEGFTATYRGGHTLRATTARAPGSYLLPTQVGTSIVHCIRVWLAQGFADQRSGLAQVTSPFQILEKRPPMGHSAKKWPPEGPADLEIWWGKQWSSGIASHTPGHHAPGELRTEMFSALRVLLISIY